MSEIELEGAVGGARDPKWRADQSTVNAAKFVPPSDDITRVGRWMFRAKYEKMLKTGYVQKPYSSNQSYVACPASPGAFYKQAEKGCVYVKFDVPTSSIRQTKDVWATIPGPGSIYSKLGMNK